jgi:multidrug efflux system membrane fusion protein
MSTRLETLRKGIHLCLAVGLMGVSGGLAAWLIATRPSSSQRPAPPRLPCVEVVSVEPQTFAQPVVGYGTVRPKRQVNIVPEVTGRLVHVHPKLLPGNHIGKGELLFEVDSRSYEARVRQVEADIARLETELKRHAQEKASLERRLALAKERAELAEKNLAVETGLLKDDSTTQIEVDAARERLLTQRDVVLQYESRLALIPLLVEETQALLDTKRAQLEEARLSVERTKIYCPFDARVDSVRAQESQVVTASFQIATLTDMEALEVGVVVDPRELRWTNQAAYADASGSFEGAPEAVITSTIWGQRFTWRGHITRVERVDEATRTAHVVVEIRELAASLTIGDSSNRPALSIGMMCRAALDTEPLEHALVVPRQAIQDGRRVYVFAPNADVEDPTVGRLVVKRVPILRSVNEQVVVAYGDGSDGASGSGGDAEGEAVCELRPGDRLVVSPLPKAVEGMRLRLSRESEAVALGVPAGWRLADATAPEWLMASRFGVTGVR